MRRKFNFCWIFQKLGGACRAGYPAVVASGEAACSIHYIKATQVSFYSQSEKEKRWSKKLTLESPRGCRRTNLCWWMQAVNTMVSTRCECHIEDGEWVLVKKDKWHYTFTPGYTSDITRTWPISGTFSPHQLRSVQHAPPQTYQPWSEIILCDQDVWSRFGHPAKVDPVYRAWEYNYWWPLQEDVGRCSDYGNYL